MVSGAPYRIGQNGSASIGLRGRMVTGTSSCHCDDVHLGPGPAALSSNAMIPPR
jgi:hypothetical protein